MSKTQIQSFCSKKHADQKVASSMQARKICFSARVCCIYQCSVTHLHTDYSHFTPWSSINLNYYPFTTASLREDENLNSASIHQCSCIRHRYVFTCDPPHELSITFKPPLDDPVSPVLQYCSLKRDRNVLKEKEWKEEVCE